VSTGTQTIRFNLADAQEAACRLDDGIGREGDEQLAATYERFCQQEWDKFQHAQAQDEDRAWLVAQCRVCGPDGSTGPCCDECLIGEESDL
jgi:hypothetical protein